jgi:hypothetical protein
MRGLRVAPKTLRQLGILAVLLLVLIAVLMYNQAPVPAGGQAAATTTRSRAARSLAGTEQIGAVKLPALTEARVEPETGARNPFRFRPVAPPAPPPDAARPAGPGAASGPTAGPPVPAGPPPPPPITLRFIGVVEQSARLKLAVLSDGRNVFYGKEGDAIEGRYRILRIGPESIDMAYLDGRGRQTLRLSGS